MASKNDEVDKKPPNESDYDPAWLKGTSAENEPRRPNDFSDPVYKKISRLNGKVNSMSVSELKTALAELKLDIKGEKEVLRKRLKTHYKESSLKDRNLEFKTPCKYDYVVVIDFEATCVGTQQKDYLHEIIEFPLVLINMRNLEIEESTSWHCRPIINPKLSKFCTDLTGITQEKVDAADHFPAVLDKVKVWLSERELGSRYRLAVATDGPWDCQNFLNLQCSLSEIEYPRWARKWIDVRKMFSNFLGVRRCGILKMLSYYGYEFEGSQHCGLDDAKNIARILIRLANDGCEVSVNSHLRKNLSGIDKATPNAGSNQEKIIKKSPQQSDSNESDCIEFRD